MSYQIIFWMLVATTVILIVGIMVMAGSIQAVLKSKKNKSKDNNVIKTILALVGITLLSSSSLYAQGDEQENPIFNPELSDVLGLTLVNMILLLTFFYFKSIFNNLVQEYIPASEAKERSPWFKINKVLTDAVEIEDEAVIMMDHEYDGIRELDNNLPPWWKWGFFATIVFAFIYLGHYHVFKTGDLQIAEYNKSMEIAKIEVDAYKKAQNLNVDENSVVLLTEASDLSEGKKLYTQNCVSCHGAQGEGGIGANLTDDFWLYGNDIKNVFSTIKYGAKNGMRSWDDDFNGLQIQKISSYVISLQGTDAPAGKEAEGEFYEKISFE